MSSGNVMVVMMHCYGIPGDLYTLMSLTSPQL